jgi:sulfate permease, SulP family
VCDAVVKSIAEFLPDVSKLPAHGMAYARNSLHGDVMAGLSVAVMGVPQAMAYALIAGLPPIYGLYTAIIPCFVAAVFGCSSHLVTGPTNAVCMVILSLTATMPHRYDVSHLEIVLALTFLTGVFQALFGFLKLGGVARYVSNSVIVGFTAGAGVLIVVNQLKGLMGVQLAEGQGGHFLVTFWATLQRVHEANPYALVIGLLTILMLVGFRRWLPKWPGSLIAVVVVGAAAWLAGWSEPGMGDLRVSIVRDIQEITPTFDLFMVPEMFTHPNLNLLRELFGGALALAILGLVESTSISRAIAASSGQRLDFNREFAAQGIAKMVGSFFHCFAATGSFTRSAVCYHSGGKTRMAAVNSALFTALTLAVFGPFANYIPLSSLAGIIVVTACTMIQRDRLSMTWRSGKNSQIVMGGTFASTLLMPLENAVFAGVLLSIVILLRITGKPDLTQLVQHPDYGFEEVPFNRAAPAPVAIINLEGDLYFAAAEDLDYELLQALKPETRVVVLRMKRLRAVGSSAMAMLEHFQQLLHARGIHLIVCGIEEEMTSVLTGSGLRKLIGEQNIFYADNRIFQSTELALARAMTIVDMQRSRSESVAVAAQKETLVATAAADLMQKRCLRFGSRHQLREAMWLISQFQKRMGTGHPQTVFLQDEDGRLCAELSVRSILRSLASVLPDDGRPMPDDARLAALLEPRLFAGIGEIAGKNPVSLDARTPLAEVFLRAARNGFRPMPVSDQHGRLSGVFDEMAMLRGLTRLLQARQAMMDGPPPDKPAPAPEEPRP